MFIDFFLTCFYLVFGGNLVFTLRKPLNLTDIPMEGELSRKN